MNNLPNKKTEFTFLLVRVPSLGQHSEGVILGSPQNVDRPNASYAALKDTAPRRAASPLGHAPKVVL